MTTTQELPAGLADKVMSAQSVFRSVMEAMARPASVQPITPSVGTPSRMMRGTAAIALTLFDHDTPVWLDTAFSETLEVAKWLKFHTGTPVVADPSICSFALIGDVAALPELMKFSVGTDTYPDRSTSIILQVASLTQGPSYELSGPGIDGVAAFKATIEPSDLFDRLAINASLFPRGIDVVLVADDVIVAIPRTTKLVKRRS
ncbi:MAG: phosphonate C-P lyase system protein PhnH [Rhizobiales bacterium]|nr:phosphonate C-P lyase system protein PhnH [Hyphomicrobiales bacterium]